MRSFRYFVVFGMAALVAAALLQSKADALMTMCSGSAAGVATPAPTPVATGVATSVTNGTSISTASTTNKSVLIWVQDAGGGLSYTNTLAAQYKATAEVVSWTAGHDANVLVDLVGPTIPGASISGLPTASVACQFAVANTGGNLDATTTVETAATSTTPTCPSITTNNTNTEVVCACVWNPSAGTVSYTQPAGMTLEKTVAGVSGTNIGCAISDEVFAAAGATGALQGTLNTSSTHQCFTIAIGQR